MQVAEQKYADEMVQHSADIQQLSILKEKVQKTKQQFDELKLARDQAGISGLTPAKSAGGIARR